MMRVLAFSLTVIALTGSLATAQEADPISTKAIYACSEITDDTERLRCYDDTVGRFAAAEAAGEVTTISKAEIDEIREDSFGFSLPSIPRIVMPKLGGGQTDEIDRVLIAVAEIERTRYGEVRVTLENGQVWEQTDGKRIQFSKRLGVDTATIKRASFGSFMMQLDAGASFRVKRIQ